MRTLAGCLALVAVLPLGVAAVPAGKSAEGDADRLVRQLGSRKYAERAAATRLLEALGEPALPLLRRAAVTADLEMRRRAAALLMRIEQRAEAARLLTGKRVRLVYRDTPIAEAIEDLAARTGFDLRLDDEAAALGKLTLDTGATTAWDALRQFCRKAGLTELAPQSTDEPIRLSDVPAQSLPTHLAGAVRVRALPLASTKGAPPNAQGFRLEAMPEPGMPWQGVVGVRLTRAVDERGQELKQPALTLGAAPVMPGRPLVWDGLSGQPLMIPADRRALPVWLTGGKTPATRLREVQGRLVVQVSVSRQLLAVDRVLQAEGKTFNSPKGQSLKVLKVTRTADSLRLRVQLTAHGSGGMALFQVVRTRDGTLVMRGGPRDTAFRFVLQDANGAVVRPRIHEQLYVPRPAAGLRVEFQLTLALKEGQPVPDRLICYGPVATLLEVPFTLREVLLSARRNAP